MVVFAAAVPGRARAGDEARPFTLVLTGNANPVPTDDPCVLINTETGTGVAAPLGLVRWHSREVVNFCTNPEGAEIEGEFTITTWNRDELRGHYRTVGQADPEAAEITAIGRYEVTGGTGRLAGATGKGVIAAAGSLAPPFAFNGGLFGRLSF
jgi:hypothetical protein